MTYDDSILDPIVSSVESWAVPPTGLSGGNEVPYASLACDPASEAASVRLEDDAGIGEITMSCASTNTTLELSYSGTLVQVRFRCESAGSAAIDLTAVGETFIMDSQFTTRNDHQHGAVIGCALGEGVSAPEPPRSAPPQTATGTVPSKTPLPADEDLSPLLPIPGGREGLADVPVVTDEGKARQAGLFMFMASPEFNTGLMGKLSANVAILVDELNPLGKRLIIARVPDEELDAVVLGLAGQDGVLAGPDKAYVGRTASNDPYWSNQENAGLSLLNLHPAWSISTGVSSVRVAVVDTGVNVIPELANRVVAGYNAFNPLLSTADELGHGTMVASVIAARKDNNVGIAGVAPNARIVPVEACDLDPNDPTKVRCLQTVIVTALNWLVGEALEGRLEVVNLSLWDLSGGTIDQVLSDLDQLGVITVAASGNAGNAQVSYPARNQHVVAVGGVYPNGPRHIDSNYGSDLDVVAPYQNWAMNHNNAPIYFQGTSASAAVISGLAALFKSAHFVETSTRSNFMSAISENGATWNSQTGYGVPDAYEIVGEKTFLCVRYDIRRNYQIDVADAQTISFRYGSVRGDALYHERFDLQSFSGTQPPDGDIDAGDLQKVFGRIWLTCKAP